VQPEVPNRRLPLENPQADLVEPDPLKPDVRAVLAAAYPKIARR
jgi:hypothetical protein